MKLDFILKITGMCTNCIFKNQSMFIKTYRILVNISRKQQISLLSVLPLKLMTPLSIIAATTALPRTRQPKLSGWLGRRTPG